MYTWNYKPNEYGKITTASIQELKEKTNALVCSSVNSTYCVTHHYSTTYSGNSTQCPQNYSTDKNSQRNGYHSYDHSGHYGFNYSSINSTHYDGHDTAQGSYACTGQNTTN